MKTVKIYLTVTLLIVFITSPLFASGDTTKILFIGNSYTYVNDLPTTFDSLSVSGGKTVFTDVSAVGGYSLQDHTTDTTTLNKIRETKWNYIVLQEQSQIPTIPYYRYNSMYPSARILDSLIRKDGASTVFFMTWGREYGGQQCLDTSCSPVFRDFFQMEDSLKSAYTELSAMLNSVLASVGEGWRVAKTLDTSIDLWQPDYSHPTVKGTYLAACVFYVTLFHESPIGLSYTDGLSSSDALFLQNAAYQLIIGIRNDHNTAEQFRLYQNYPNPFNPNTVISYQLAVNSFVKLAIYDILGRTVETLVNGQVSAGEHKPEWHAENYPSGVYFYKLTAGPYSKTMKMVLIK